MANCKICKGEFDNNDLTNGVCDECYQIDLGDCCDNDTKLAVVVIGSGQYCSDCYEKMK